MRLLSLQNSKGSSSSALGTRAEGQQQRGGCRDKGQQGNAICQLPELCHTAERDLCQRSASVEERALELLTEAKLGAVWPFSRAGVTLKVTFSNPCGIRPSHHTTTPSPT